MSFPSSHQDLPSNVPAFVTVGGTSSSSANTETKEVIIKRVGWKCDACFTFNKNLQARQCAACEARNPAFPDETDGANGIAASPASGVPGFRPPATLAPSNPSSSASSLPPPVIVGGPVIVGQSSSSSGPDKEVIIKRVGWKCNACFTFNKNLQATQCAACEAPNPALAGDASDASSSSTPASATTPPSMPKFIPPTAVASPSSSSSSATGTITSFGFQPGAAFAFKPPAATSSSSAPTAAPTAPSFAFKPATSPAFGFAPPSNSSSSSSSSSSSTPSTASEAHKGFVPPSNVTNTSAVSSSQQESKGQEAKQSVLGKRKAADEEDLSSSKRVAVTPASSSSSISAPSAPVVAPAQPANLTEAKVEPIPLDAKTEGLGTVLSFGSGDMAQLGLGLQTRLRKFPAVIPYFETNKIDVVSISAGALHNCVVSADGKVYSWGCNDDGALGRYSELEKEEWEPRPVKGNREETAAEKKERIAREARQKKAREQRKKEKLDRGEELDSDDDREEPTYAEYDPEDGDDITKFKIIKVCSGASHSIALSECGKVWAWGSYRDQGGLVGFRPGSKIAKHAVEIKFNASSKSEVVITDIAAGESHCLCCDSKGRVYYWGDVFIGRKLSERKSRKITRLAPTEVRLVAGRGSKLTDDDKFATQVFAGGYSCFALARSGKLWVWGPNNYGQLGIPHEEDELSVIAPVIHPFFDEILMKSLTNVNANNQSSVSGPLPTPAAAASTPSRSRGRPKAGKSSSSAAPLVAPSAASAQGIRVKQCASASHFSVVLTTDGVVYTMGRTEDGRLGRPRSTFKSAECATPIVVEGVSKEALTKLNGGIEDEVDSVACGETHALVVTKCGRLLTWGAGELLQLGNGIEKVSEVPYNVVSQQLSVIKRKVIMASGGSQHSLILAKKFAQ